MLRVIDKLNQFDTVILDFYNKAETQPNTVLKQTANLVQEIKIKPDPDNIRWNKLGALYDLRAETFYKLGEYRNSIEESIKDENYSHEVIGSGEINHFSSASCLALASNYVKLKKFDLAKTFLDSAGFNLFRYEKANYYEAIGDKKKAIELYNEIKKDKSTSHYIYYQDALKRIEELNKMNPKLLNEISYYSTRPDRKLTLDE